MSIPIVDSRDLPNSWRLVDDKIRNFRSRGLPFRYQYVGSFAQSLAEYFVRVYSNPGDTLFDIFGGRGTVAMQSLHHGRNMIINDLSSYSNVLCHSILYPPYMRDVTKFIDILEDYIKENVNSISIDYPGKGGRDDISKLYHPDTFDDIIKLRNLINNKKVLLGKGIGKFDPEYEHEIVMFIRASITQLMLGNSMSLTFNGLKIRGTDNTNVRALLRYYDSLGEKPLKVNIFERLKNYIEKMNLDDLNIKDRFGKLDRKLLACDGRLLDLPDRMIDGVITSPAYLDVLNYGMINWARLWSINRIGDPLIKPSIDIDDNKIDNIETSEIYGSSYDKVTDSTGSTVANIKAYSTFTGQYLKELYRVLKDDAFAIIVVGDYGSKRKLEAWRLVVDRAVIFGFKPIMVIMDRLNVDTKSSSQFQSKFGGGKNQYDVCVILYKGNYKRKNDPSEIDFRWGAKFKDDRQKSIEEAWGY